MDVICFGQQGWDVCWVTKQHLLSRLAKRGHRVLYVDPLPVRGGERRIRTLAAPLTSAGLREQAPRLWVQTLHDSPLLPRIVNARRRPWIIRAAMRRLRFDSPLCLALYPHARWLVEHTPHHGLIYFGEDDWTGFGGLTPKQAARLREEEETLLTRSDVALAVSPRLVQRFRQIQPRTYLQENAVDAEFFGPEHLDDAEPHPDLDTLPRPRLGFIGQVDDRLDPDLIARLSASFPESSLVLTGRVAPTADEARLRALPNVHLTGYVSYEELPGVMRGLDVLLVPYRQTQLTQSCNPLKVYEYLATGRPVVSVDLEGLGVTRGVIRTARSHEEFVAQVREALADPKAGREARLAAAAANSWEERTDLLEARMEEAKRRAPLRAQERAGLRGGGLRGEGGPTWPRARRKPAVVLDAKEESERRLAADWANQRFNPLQRSFFELSRVAGWLYWVLRLLWRAVRGGRGVSAMEPRRILVVRHGHLGDMIAYLPALVALRHCFPDAHLAVAVGPGSSVRGLLEAVTEVDEVLTLDFMEHERRLERLRGAWRLWRRGFDLMVCGIGPFMVREALFAGSPRRWTLWEGHPWQRLCNRRVALDPMRHEAQNNLRLVAALGAVPLPEQQAPRLTLDAGVMAEAERELDASLPLGLPVGEGAGGELVAIHAGSKRPSRRWPPERFVELTRRLLESRPGVRVVFTGTPDEAELIDSIRKALPRELRERTVSAAGRTSLLSAVVLLGRCRLVICNDTGMLHVARALRRPLLALLGPENDLRWGPHPELTQEGQASRSAGGGETGKDAGGAAVALRVVVPCAPCVKWECREHYCLRSLGVEEALSAALELLEGEAAGDLDLRRRRLDWRALAAAGFDVPGVTALVLATTGEGAEVDGAAAVRRVRATLAALRASGYPRLRVMVVAQPTLMATLTAAGLGEVALRVGGADDGASGAAVRVALAESQGDYVVLYHAGETAGAMRLDEDVASLYRSPQAGWVMGDEIARLREAQAVDPPPPIGALMRRELLRSRLVTPTTNPLEESASPPPLSTDDVPGWNVLGSADPVAPVDT